VNAPARAFTLWDANVDPVLVAVTDTEPVMFSRIREAVRVGHRGVLVREATHVVANLAGGGRARDDSSGRPTAMAASTTSTAIAPLVAI